MKDPRKQNTRIRIIQILFILITGSSCICAQELKLKEYQQPDRSMTFFNNFNKYNATSIDFYKADKRWDSYNYYSSFMGSFCKLEHQSSKSSGMAIRMRLGNLNTVNALEMKLPAWRMVMLEESRL